jgi:Ca2+-binding RTX toxin-like protein
LANSAEELGMEIMQASLAAENAAPEVDLNGDAAGTGTRTAYRENSAPVAIAPYAVATDDSADLEGGSLTVAFTAGGTADDQLRIAHQGFGRGQFFAAESDLYYEGVLIGSITGGTDGSTPLLIIFHDNVTPAIAQALIRSIGYANFSQDPVEGERTVTFTLADGDGGTSLPVDATIHVTAVETPAVAEDDTIWTDENAVSTGSVFDAHGPGPDYDPDGPKLTVSKVNGSAANVGETLILKSGAKLTVNADGTYSYDPNGRFETLTDDRSSAVNISAVDTFQYTLANGNTATVTVIVNGVAGPGDWLMGDETGNFITGTDRPDLFLLQQGGDDAASGGGGNDLFYFGAAFTRLDRADGGDGRDAVVLQGNYALRLSATNLAGVEALSLQSGANAKFGDTANKFYDYAITTDDANVAAGEQMIVNGQSLRAGEDLTFDGSAERDGKFLVYGGNGVDRLKGGDGNDIFYFEGDRFGPSDRVDGGGGRDTIVISAGNGLKHIEFGANSLTSIESISISAKFASDPSARPSYELVLDNGNVAQGDTLIVNGGSLADPVQRVSIDGSAVHDGKLRLFGGAGNDRLTGGGGGDLLQGGLGGDSLTGNAGADIFRYAATGDSSASSMDKILDFAPGVDLVDLHLVDANTQAAGDQDFHWIGSDAFTGTGAASAGELRVHQNEGVWFVEGDTDGNGAADLVIALILPSDTEFSFSDFLT